MFLIKVSWSCSLTLRTFLHLKVQTRVHDFVMLVDPVRVGVTSDFVLSRLTWVASILDIDWFVSLTLISCQF